MGQYYRPLIIHADRSIDVLNSFDFNNTQKLMDHSWIGNSFVNAVYVILNQAPCRLAWMGDYAKDEATEFIEKAGGQDQFLAYYKAAWENNTKHILKPTSFSEYNLIDYLNINTRGTYLINHTQQVYLSMEKYIVENMFKEEGCSFDWCINPLPLLTACANGSGGSYHGTHMEDVGTWAFDEIEYSDQFSATYKEVTYRFKEHNEG